MKAGEQRLTQRKDLWLLVCLEALVEELSVTRAAERLGTTQPAMSNTLARLRSVLGDPVLVKSAQGVVATRRAQQLVRDTVVQRRDIESALNRSVHFDLSSSRGRVVLSMTDPHSTFVLPPLFERAAEQATNLEIVTRLPDHTRIRQWLENGGWDIAIGYFPDLPNDLRSIMLYDDTVSVVSRDEGGVAAASAMSLEAYLARRHLMIGAPFSRGWTRCRCPASTCASRWPGTREPITIRHSSGCAPWCGTSSRACASAIAPWALTAEESSGGDADERISRPAAGFGVPSDPGTMIAEFAAGPQWATP